MPALSKHGDGAEFGVEHEGLSAHQGKFPCLSGALSAASPSINPVVNTANTQTHIHIHISPTNREVSLEEAAAVAGVTAVLKSGTLVPVNSNLALRLPLSHSVQPPQTHTYTHSPTQGRKRRGLRRRWCVLSGELISTVGERVNGDRKERGKKRRGRREDKGRHEGFMF